jgi:hypothetical protein
MDSGGGGMDAGCSAVPTTCDGAEDCPSGQRCCGRVQGMQPAFRYVEFGCFASCNMSADGGPLPEGGGGLGGPTWLELCHAGDTCENSMYQCLTSQYLPNSFSRCFTPADAAAPNPGLGKAANAVNCGNAVCSAGEKCCIRQPLEPYCAPASETCQCERTQPEGGGGSDGGPDADASTDSARDVASDVVTTDSPVEGSADAPGG